MPPLDKMGAFAEYVAVDAAIAKIATGHSQGKVILKVDDEE